MIGSKENPFNNINELFDHVLKIERQMVINDPEYTIYKQTGFCFNGHLLPVPEWLWPDTASKYNDPTNKMFVATKQRSGSFSFKPVISNRKFLFRGQKEEYPTCVPTLFRDKNKKYFLKEMILNHEMWCLIDSHPLVQLLGIHGIKLNGINYKMRTNYGGIGQHYDNQTMFLDLTSDVDTAKFFACTDFNTAGCKPHEDEGIGIIYCYEIFLFNGFQMIRDSRTGEIHHHLSTIGKQIFPRSGAQYGFLLNMGKGVDLNSFGNVRKYYFKHDSEISRKILEDSDYGKKYIPPSILDEYWNEKMSSRRTDRLISNQAVEVNLSYNPKETKSSLTKKLNQRGYTITNKVTSFNPDQLNSYYQDIRNGWWSDVFCKDIVFYGSEASKIKDEFLSIEKNPDYAFAFDANAPKPEFKFDPTRYLKMDTNLIY